MRDVQVVDGCTRSVRVIGKRNRECLVPLPEAFGQVFGFWKPDAEVVDIQALLGHVNLATTQIYTHVSGDWIAGVVASFRFSKSYSVCYSLVLLYNTPRDFYADRYQDNIYQAR